MTWEFITILIIVVSTLIIYLLHKVYKNKVNKFANIINKLWDEWFEEQWKSILALVILASIFLIIIFMFRQ